MKTTQKSVRSKAALIAVASVLVLLGMVILPLSPVFAQDLEGQKSEASEFDNQDFPVRFLEIRFKRESLRAERCVALLQRAAEMQINFEQRISELAAEGKDITELEAGLAEFRTGIEAAGIYYDEAAPILTEHAGFDDDGNVTDIELARATVNAMDEPLRDCIQNIRNAVRASREAVREFRQDNPAGDDCECPEDMTDI